MLSSASALDCNKKMMAGVVWSAAVWHVDFLWQHFAKVLTPRSPNENQDDFSHLAAEFIYITLRKTTKDTYRLVVYEATILSAGAKLQIQDGSRWINPFAFLDTFYNSENMNW